MLQVRVLPGLYVFRSCAVQVGSVGVRDEPRGLPMNKMIRFFKESYGELKKVTWPSREEVAASTRVVLVSVILIALALGVVDFLIFRGIDLIF
jgi:preprotein translocase subunit SecE